MSSPEAEPRYTVEYTPGELAHLRWLMQLTALMGDGPAFLNSVRQIDETLRTTPAAFGEPLYRLRAMELEVRVGVIQPASVRYGVNAERRFVWVVRFEALRGQWS